MVDIDRINFLAKKSKTSEGLTPEEKQEQTKLRREYIDSIKGQIIGQLENVYIVDSDGVKHSVSPKAGEDGCTTVH